MYEVYADEMGPVRGPVSRLFAASVVGRQTSGELSGAWRKGPKDGVPPEGDGSSFGALRPSAAA